MTKAVFRPTEIVNLTSRIIIEAPGAKVEEVEEVEEVQSIPEYEGPHPDDLRREAEEFKANFELEKERMLEEANAEAERIVKNAEVAAFEEVRRKQNQAQKMKVEAEEEAARTINDGKLKAQEIEAQANARLANVEREAHKKGFDQGREEGYREGKNEVERLTNRLHIIMDRAMEKRGEILEQTENEVVELVLLIARKVIKVISENQKNVVISNVAQALRKLKAKGDVIVRVNLSDLQLTTNHIKDFMDSAENAKNITVVEDQAVDKGGCIIETDFGQIDARIASQLHEIEDKILDVAPIRSRSKNQTQV